MAKVPLDPNERLFWGAPIADLLGQEIHAPKLDPIYRPSHYAEGREYEPYKVIQDWGLNYFAGNALKYISRYERKGAPVDDLRKAIRYLEMELENHVNPVRP
jgi:hypothetical protein